MEVQALFLAQVPLPEGIDHQIVVQLLAQVLLLEGPQQPTHIGGSAIQRPIQRQYRALRGAGAQPPGHITGAVAATISRMRCSVTGETFISRALPLRTKETVEGDILAIRAMSLMVAIAKAPFLCDSSILPKFARKVNSSRKA